MLLSSAASLAIRVGGAAASFGFQVLLARLLGPANLGVYHTANSVAQLVAVIGRRGLDNVLVRRVSVAQAEGQHAQTQQIVAAVLRVLTLNTSALAALMIAVALLAGKRWLAHEDAVPSLIVFALAALPLALIAILGEALKAVGRPLVSAAVQGLAVPTLNLTAIAFVGIFGIHLMAASVASWVFLASTLLATALGAWLWRDATPGTTSGVVRCDTRKLTVEARPFFIAAVASMAAGSADILILSVYGQPEQVGIYAVAARIAVLFSLVSLGVNGVVAPRFAQLAAAGELAALRRLSQRACATTAAAGLPLLLIAAVAPAGMLGLFGPRFAEGTDVLQLVVAGRYVAVVSAPLGHLFQMAGLARIERNLSLGMAVALIVLAVPLTIRFGATGTATAACIAWAMLGLARVVAAVTLFRSGLR